MNWLEHRPHDDHLIISLTSSAEKAEIDAGVANVSGWR
ncbi:hypothetical protein ACVWZV_009723 [Bradyrhizobium sp. GM5.1]